MEPSQSSLASRGQSTLFAVSLLSSAFLLFSVQPMVAKMLLPLLGGSPTVWNTCMVFFQVSLLLGYLYAHASVRWLGVRRQAALHVGLLLVPLAVLPIQLPAGWLPPASGTPIPWLLGALAVTAGLPFFALSTAGPLLQRWFAETPHPSAGDPYFLYAASNLGSLLALSAYPLVVEPMLTIGGQTRVWRLAYVAVVALVAGCAVFAARGARDHGRGAAAATGPHTDDPVSGIAPEPLTMRRRLRWTLLVFVPSSLMLGVTTHVSMDIAAVPLLWVIPLGLYLLTFVIAFSTRPLLPHRWMLASLPFVILLPVFSLLAPRAGSAWMAIPLHLASFFLVGMAAHGELARDRPSAGRLTEFYVWVSLGGALGGVFNALVAPAVFTGAWEYPVALVLACLLTRTSARRPRLRPAVRLAVACVPGLLVAVAFSAWSILGLPSGSLAVTAVVLAIPLLGTLLLASRPIAFALAVGLVIVAGSLKPTGLGRVLHVERSYFGILRVFDRGGTVHFLVHGTTTHGAQASDPRWQCEPLTYYDRSGPIGQVFGSLVGSRFKFKIAVVGLGTGSLVGYAERGQDWTFFEIDPAVERIAKDRRFFRYLSDCRPGTRVVLGDARLSLANAPDGAFDVIVFDAFSSDAIPVHLLTREALDLYLRKLAQGGLMAFHISNRYLDLQPVLESLSREAGLVSLVRSDDRLSAREAERGKSTSVWACLARTTADLGDLALDPRWTPLRPGRGARWTDDFTNILAVIR